MAKKHWIAGNGSVGCLYDGCEVFDTKHDAVDYLAGLYSDFRGVKSDLLKYEIWYNPGEHSLEYCEITPCYCDTPMIHSDSYSGDYEL